jgi:hypothetical protein
MLRNSLAAGDTRGRVRIWDTSNGLIIHRLATGGRRITGLDYAVNGETLAVRAMTVSYASTQSRTGEGFSGQHPALSAT